MLRAVLFDVDFTIARPGPELGPDGYARLGARFGLELDPSRYDEARQAAIATLKRHPELDHDEEVWVLFTERIIQGMGGSGDTYACAVAMTKAWEHAEHFELYEDALPRAVLDRLGVEPAAAAMVGDSIQDDVEGARALGIKAFLLDRSGAFPEFAPRLPDLFALPAALGLEVHRATD